MRGTPLPSFPEQPLGLAESTGNSCPVPISNHEHIVLAHGSGGRMTHRLLENLILPQFQNPHLAPLHDGAIFSIGTSRFAFSTDSFVVHPIFFPGGDIGSLAVNGTVNDLAMCGARARYLAVALILEEGLPIADLQRVLKSMRLAADSAGVELVTGDTKVVDRGKGDQIFINTAGVGICYEQISINPANARPGDAIIVSGPVAAHGIAIMTAREGLQFETQICSDTAALNGLVEKMLETRGEIHVLRDPTRGGLTSALSEIAQQSGVGIRLDESAIPIDEAVKAACELLGLDPLYVANEGVLLAFVAPHCTDAVLAAMRAHPLGRQSAVIGHVAKEQSGLVTMRTQVGGNRVVDMLSGEQLPRIC